MNREHWQRMVEWCRGANVTSRPAVWPGGWEDCPKPAGIAYGSLTSADGWFYVIGPDGRYYRFAAFD